MVQNFKECREWVKIKLLKELFLKSLESGSKLNYLRIVIVMTSYWSDIVKFRGVRGWVSVGFDQTQNQTN